MSPARKPSTVAGLRRGVAATPEMPERTATAEELAEERAKIQRGRAMAARRDGIPPRPEKPTRFTLDLDRDRHQFLKEHAVSIGVDASQLLRALLDELRDDDDLQGRIWTRIWQPR